MLRTHQPVTFPEAKKLETNGARLVTCKFADRILAEGAIKSFHGSFWTNTFIVYPEAGKQFFDTTTMRRGLFSLTIDTKEFSGMRDVAISFDEYDISIQERTITYHPKSVRLIETFPREDGWYGARDGLPTERGGTVLRYMWRTPSAYIGPVVRSKTQPSDIYLNKRIIEQYAVVLN